MAHVGDEGGLEARGFERGVARLGEFVRRAFDLRDVAQKRGDKGQLAVRIAQRRQSHGDVEQSAVLVQPLRFEVLPARAGQDKGHILLLLFVAPGGEYPQILQSAANCLRRRVTQKALGRRVPARYDAG